MTDHSHIYVYTGITSGSLTNGNWYYWDASLSTPAWVSGGAYMSAVDISSTKVSKPLSNGSPTNGTNGQLLKTNGDGTTSWIDSYDDEISDLKSALYFVENTLDLVVPYNIFNANHYETGYDNGWYVGATINATTGLLDTVTTPIAVTYLIPVYNKKKVCLKYGSGQIRGTLRHVGAYDKSGNFIGLSGVNLTEYTLPYGTCYVRIEHNYGQVGDTSRLKNKITVCDDSTVGTEYKNFFEPYDANENDGHNSYDLLRRFGSYYDRTTNGVEFTWNKATKTCHAEGTATSTAATILYYNETKLPPEIIAGEKYFFKCKTTDNNLMLEMQTYDGEDSYTTFITNDREIIIPVGTVGLLLRIRSRNSTTVDANITVSILNTKSNKDLSIITNSLLSNYMQIFPKYTTIGDSLMAGFMNRDGVSVNSATAKEKGNNWVNYIALRTGRIFTNLAVGGSTAKSWRESLIADANIDTDCYLIGIGVNDKRNSLSIGTTSDISTQFANNADSFYGNYDFILRQLMTWNEDCHIFCFTIPAIEGGSYADYNSAIRTICALYPEQVHCIDLSTDYAMYFNSSVVTDNYTGNHFNPLAYNYMSSIIEMAINNYIEANNGLFATTPYA